MLPLGAPCPHPHLFYLMSATVTGPELNCVTTKQQVSCLALWVSKIKCSWPLINLVVCVWGGTNPSPKSKPADGLTVATAAQTTASWCPSSEHHAVQTALFCGPWGPCLRVSTGPRAGQA